MARDVTVTLEIRGVPDSKLDQGVIEALKERLVGGSADQQAPWTEWEAMRAVRLGPHVDLY